MAPLLPPHKNPCKNHTQVVFLPVLWSRTGAARAQPSISATQFPIPGEFQLPLLCEPWAMAAARCWWVAVPLEMCIIGSALHSGQGGLQSLCSARHGRKRNEFAMLWRSPKSCRNLRIPWAQLRGWLAAPPMTQDPARTCLSQAAASRAQILNRIPKNLHRKPRFVTTLSFRWLSLLAWTLCPQRTLNLVSKLPRRGSAAWTCPAPLPVIRHNKNKQN